MYKPVENIDLKKYSYVDLTYKIQDPSIQTIEIVLDIDYTGDGIADLRVGGIYPSPASTIPAMYYLDAYEEINEIIPNKEHYNLMGIGLKLTKFGGINARVPWNQGYYEYDLKSLRVHMMNFSSLTTNYTIQIDEHEFKLPQNKINNQYEMGSIQLEKGYHDLAINYGDSRTNYIIQIRSNDLEAKLEKESSSAQIIKYQRVDPTNYVAHINATGPFFLVFSESYSDGWKAYIDGEEVTEHIMVNGYANGWYINKTGEYAVDIVYEPQKIFLVGVLISVVLMIMSIIYLLYHRH
jgi:hypothetical protein